MELPSTENPAIADFSDGAEIVGGEVLPDIVGRENMRPMCISVAGRDGKQVIVNSLDQLQVVGEIKGGTFGLLLECLRTADRRCRPIPQGIHIEIVFQITAFSVQLQRTLAVKLLLAAAHSVLLDERGDGSVEIAGDTGIVEVQAICLIGGNDSYANSLALNVQITYLRRMLKTDASISIVSLKKRGYILSVK